MEFLNDLDPLLKTFWFIALPASLIFLIQTVMTFVGMDSGDGLEADFNSDLSDTAGPTQLFSFRNLINFLLGFSWSGIAFRSSIEQNWLLITLAFIVGTAFLLLFFVVIKQVQKLAEDNSFRMDETVNKTAEVYLKIPGEKGGKGKVLISIRGSMRELDAITAGSLIETGSIVRVLQVDGDLLIVEKL